MNHNSYSGIGGIADILLVWANFLFGFLVVSFFIIIVAPLFGGKLLPIEDLIPFAYWAGYYFVTRYFLLSMRNKTRLKDYRYWLIGLYFSSLALDTSNPFSYLAFFLIFLLFLIFTKREIKSWDNNTFSNYEAAS